jgi:hypothetical protein
MELGNLNLEPLPEGADEARREFPCMISFKPVKPLKSLEATRFFRNFPVFPCNRLYPA